MAVKGLQSPYKRFKKCEGLLKAKEEKYEFAVGT